MMFTAGETYGFKYLPPGKTNRRHVKMIFQYATESASGDISLTFAGSTTGFRSFRADQIQVDRPKHKLKDLEIDLGSDDN